MVGKVILILVIFLPTYAAADISGNAAVTDGDTIRIGDERIRLYGIDAPEKDQVCRHGQLSWPCGDEASKALATMVEGKLVRCLGEKRDRYKRLIATCSTADAMDLGASMVAQGWALAYRRYSCRYRGAEHTAKARKLGMWQGEFVAPWRFRDSGAPDERCSPAR